MWGIAEESQQLRRVSLRLRRSRTLGSVRAVLRGNSTGATLELSGELDFTCADALEHLVLGGSATIVALDVSGLEFVDSQGVLALQRIATELGDRGDTEPLEIRGLSLHVQRIFDLVDQAQMRHQLAYA